jgi:hypothetical protein
MLKGIQLLKGKFWSEQDGDKWSQYTLMGDTIIILHRGRVKVKNSE